ncbi:MAG: RNA polymerase sigma factor [Prevotella sp.]|nr:RNA polymerase sigma factor [Prevotella sp.]
MNFLGTDTEQQIIRLFRRGDASAMDRLYAAYADVLTGVCARYIVDDDDLKDVLQESFIKIYTKIDGFEYRGKGSLKAWMVRIVVNESLSFLRAGNRLPTTSIDTDPPDLSDEPPGTDGLTPDDAVALLRELPDGYRTVLNLYVIEGKSHKEIAGLLGIKPDSSASQYHRAKQMLARLIRQHKHDKR